MLNDCSGKSSNANLNKDKVWARFVLSCKLFINFLKDSSITINDPGWNFFIARPGCIGDYKMALILFQSASAYCFIVCAIDNCYLCSLAFDGVDTALGHPKGNKDV